MPTADIRLLSSGTNEKGDLFGELMTHLFLALGYDNCRLNIHQAGRELDLRATHRTERRVAVAECKATSDPVGGADTNKFFGVLDVERRKTPPLTTTGYMVSLNGFRESAEQQEIDAGDDRFIRLDGRGVLEELVSGRIVVPLEKATEHAGRCVPFALGSDLHLDDTHELIAHARGWIWAVYYRTHGERTHVAFVHADGVPLSEAIGRELLETDRLQDRALDGLQLLRPPAVAAGSRTDEAQQRYFEYLATDFGRITLEGLPADQEVGSAQIRLEDLFVPLRLVKLPEGRDEDGSPSPSQGGLPHLGPSGTTVGDVLSGRDRLAILAAPGAGKSTLLKRLAVAYAFPDRRDEVVDRLPDRAWLPLVVRCRQLEDPAHTSVLDVLADIPRRAEIPELSEDFDALVSDALRTGEALLLIDGLDEIAEEGARVAFVSQLRTFLATYPTVAVVVTSREAGFRVVGGALSTLCAHYRIADFSDEDIRQLVVAWYRHVVGAGDGVAKESGALADSIIASSRVRLLAQNPLLLTTLLLVQRWVGELPRKRTVLYAKAIEVLLMTWNVEGHEPIDQDEAVPQLAFVAYAMSEDGVQEVLGPRLRDLLVQARHAMPDVLGYARLGVAEFIERIEERSSVLTLTGHVVENGMLVPAYEFKHLTFQEFLTAVAAVEGFHTPGDETQTLASKLASHFDDAEWKEIIPLAAVLDGRRASGLIENLVDHVSKLLETRQQSTRLSQMRIPTSAEVLLRCLVDEVQLPPPLAERAIAAAVSGGTMEGPDPIGREALASRYGPTFVAVAEQAFMKATDHLSNCGSSLTMLTVPEHLPVIGARDDESQGYWALDLLARDDDELSQAKGALAVMHMAWQSSSLRRSGTVDLSEFGDMVVRPLESDHPSVHFAAAWAFAWLGESKTWSTDNHPRVLARLFELWRCSTLQVVQAQAAWAISTLPLLPRESEPLGVATDELTSFLLSQYEGSEDLRDLRGDRLPAALVAGYYLRAPWSDKELQDILEGEPGSGSDTAFVALQEALTPNP